MKKLILVTLLSALFCSCNQDSKSRSQRVENNLMDSASVIQKPTENIDIVQTSPNQARVLMENEHVRIVEYFIQPGDKDVWHTHPPRSSYVVAGGKVKVYTENAEPKISEVKTGTSSWADQGAKHYVENIGDTDIKIILTEIKSME